MASFKSHPLFYTTLLLAGALTAGQAWLIFSQRLAARKVAESIVAKQDALQAFSRANPFPSRENLTAIEADLASAEKIREEIRERLRATGEVADKIAASKLPETPSEEWFNINSFVFRMQAVAAEANVVVPPEYRFGFSVHEGSGPERELIPAVSQQRLYAEYLLETLLRSGAASIVSLQREQPITSEQKRQRDEAIAGGMQPPSLGTESGGSGDFFVIDPRISARVPGFVETIPFRLTFTGLTDSLRKLLNELVAFKVPVVVRSVEVEPLADSSTKRQAQRPAPRRQALDFEGAVNTTPVVEEALVNPSPSRFIVTVEILSLVDKTDPVATDSEIVSTITP